MYIYVFMTTRLNTEKKEPAISPDANHSSPPFPSIRPTARLMK